MTIDPKKLALAREWAEWVKDNPSVPVGHVRDLPRAAADIISSLPDQWVNADELREVIEQMQDSLYVPAFTRHEGEHNSEIRRWKAALEALLPDPPTMAEIEWDYEEHRLAEATVSELSGRLHEKVLMVEIDDFGHIRSLDPTTREMWSLSPGRLTPTGRRYRLEPEDASPRPDGCCGACPEIVGGGYDCTCADNPRCPNYQPRPEDVTVGGPWQMEDAEPDPAYIYTDRDGDEWECIDGWWFTGDTHAKRVAKREYRIGRVSLPEEYGPYTRITKEPNHHD